MPRDFDEAYGEYQRVLIQLNEAEDIPTKNARFRQLTELLSEMEQSIVGHSWARNPLGRGVTSKGSTGTVADS